MKAVKLYTVKVDIIMTSEDYCDVIHIPNEDLRRIQLGGNLYYASKAEVERCRINHKVKLDRGFDKLYDFDEVYGMQDSYYACTKEVRELLSSEYKAEISKLNRKVEEQDQVIAQMQDFISKMNWFCRFCSYFKFWKYNILRRK